MDMDGDLMADLFLSLNRYTHTLQRTTEMRNKNYAMPYDCFMIPTFSTVQDERRPTF